MVVVEKSDSSYETQCAMCAMSSVDIIIDYSIALQSI